MTTWAPGDRARLLGVGEVEVVGEWFSQRLRVRHNESIHLVSADSLRPLIDGHPEGMDDYQRIVLEAVEERWPNEGFERRIFALVEEVGEVARCILKAHASHDGYRDDVDWDEQLRVEAGQVGLVLASIAEAAEFSLADAMDDALDGVLGIATYEERQRAAGRSRQDFPEHPNVDVPGEATA